MVGRGPTNLRSWSYSGFQARPAVDAASFDLGELTVVVDPAGAIEECDEADNTVVIADPR